MLTDEKLRELALAYLYTDTRVPRASREPQTPADQLVGFAKIVLAQEEPKPVKAFRVTRKK